MPQHSVCDVCGLPAAYPFEASVQDPDTGRTLRRVVCSKSCGFKFRAQIMERAAALSAVWSD